MSRQIKNLYLEGKIEDEWTSLLSSSENLIESKAVYNAITALSNALDARIKILEDKHSAIYQVNGEDKETLAAAITTLNNNNGGTLTLKKNASVSETDGTTQIPSITASNVTIDGNGHTLIIGDSVNLNNGVFSFTPSTSAIKFKASEGDTSVSGIKIKDLTITSSKTSIYAKAKELSVEGVTINGSSTNSLIKMGDGANCKLVSVAATNTKGSILESTTTTGVASFYMNGCTFDGGDYVIISDNTGSKNTYVFDGGTYKNFSLPENENATLCATFLNGQQVTNDEILSTGISSEFTFRNGTELSDFTDNVLDQNLPQYPMKWYVKRNEENNSYQIFWNEFEPVEDVYTLINIRNRVLSGDCCEGERFVLKNDILNLKEDLKQAHKNLVEDLLSNYNIPDASSNKELSTIEARISYAVSNGYEDFIKEYSTISVLKDGYWDGIGLKRYITKDSGQHYYRDYPDINHCFKGMYDGNNHIISNLIFKNIEDLSGDEANNLQGLFRAVDGACFKNLSVYIGGNGFEDSILTSKYTFTWNPNQNKYESCDEPRTFGGAALVGTAINGCRIENCATFGQIGSKENPTLHTAAGVIDYINYNITDDKDYCSAYSSVNIDYILSNVTNNVNVYSTRKCAGVCGFVAGGNKITFTNVENNGNVTRTSAKYKDDAVGGLVGYCNNGNYAQGVQFDFNNVTNTGLISCDITKLQDKTLGQLIGKPATHSGNEHTRPNSFSGDIICRDDQDAMPSQYTYLNNLEPNNLWYGEQIKDTNYVKLVEPKANGTYKIMTEPKSTYTGKARITLTNAGDYVILDESLVTEANRGKANVYYNDTQLTGNVTEGTTYKYTAV